MIKTGLAQRGQSRQDSPLRVLLAPRSPPSSFFSESHPAWCLENTNLVGSQPCEPRKCVLLPGFMSGQVGDRSLAVPTRASSGFLHFPFSSLLQMERWFIREDEFNSLPT